MTSLKKNKGDAEKDSFEIFQIKLGASLDILEKHLNTKLNTNRTITAKFKSIGQKL